MKNIKLLIITFLFSSLLTACGMKGPLYQAPAAQSENAVQPLTKQDKTVSNSKEDVDNSLNKTIENN